MKTNAFVSTTIKDIVQSIEYYDKLNNAHLYTSFMNEMYGIAKTDKRYLAALVTHFATEAERSDLWTVRAIMDNSWTEDVHKHFWSIWDGNEDDFETAIFLLV